MWKIIIATLLAALFISQAPILVDADWSRLDLNFYAPTVLFDKPRNFAYLLTRDFIKRSHLSTGGSLHFFRCFLLLICCNSNNPPRKCCNNKWNGGAIYSNPRRDVFGLRLLFRHGPRVQRDSNSLQNQSCGQSLLNRCRLHGVRLATPPCSRRRSVLTLFPS